MPVKTVVEDVEDVVTFQTTPAMPSYLGCVVLPPFGTSSICAARWRPDSELRLRGKKLVPTEQR